MTPLQAVAHHVYPAMAREGLRRQGKRMWWERREDGSWVILEIQMRNGAPGELGFTVNTGAWPPSTWEHQRARVAHLADREVPYATGAPIWQRPNGVAPRLWPSDDDFLFFGRTFDRERLGGGPREFLLAALAWARARSDVEGALRCGISDYWAVAILRAVAPGDPRLAALQERYGLAVEPGPASGPAAAGH